MSQIKVTITDDRGSSDTSVSPSSTPVNTTINSTNGSINSKEVKQSQASSKGLAVASMIGSQALNYVTSNVGKWMGSDKLQRDVNKVNQAVSVGAMAFINPWLALAYVGINLATTAIDTTYEQKWDSREKEYLKKRAGELKGIGR